ncbi:glycosyltransferase [Marinobacter nauticus]|uniref:glycosyltransferase n=1 Tax=Marinobacter nauticus TaxID=2743 RepID=UPI001CD49696|nr:glycosyltransferase [Marinobacter nauticus]MCA0911870.1 glycosyltransferase [Marinobacter nauticus]
MRILAFPHKGIAYNDSFYQKIEERGINVIEGHWEGRWLLENLRNDDIIHIHWPSFLYRPHGSTPFVLKGFIRFLILFGICRFRTKRIWWTAHNLYPHKRSSIPSVDKWVRRLIITACEGVLVHGDHAKQLVLQEFPHAQAKCLTIPHGHWIGRYQPELTKLAARKFLGISPNSRLYLLFGQCQPYKNINQLVEAFLAVATKNDLLLIAGKFNDPRYLRSVIDAASGDRRVLIHNQFIPDERVSAYLYASDYFCIPYKEILTSGSAMLALSYGLPVISIERGFLRDVITPSAGLLIPENTLEELSRAIKNVQQKDWNKQEIMAEAQKYTFEDAASIFLNRLAR